CVHQNHLIRIRCDQQQILPQYLLGFLNSRPGQAYFRRAGVTTSGLVTISTSVVKRCHVPVPPIPQQQMFARMMDMVDTVGDRQRAARTRLTSLFDSLLHQAFSGELTAGWREEHRDELLQEMDEQTHALTRSVI